MVYILQEIVTYTLAFNYLNVWTFAN